MKIKVRFNHWIYKLPFLLEGLVLYPYILFRNGPEESKFLFRHELEHVYQIRREGFFKFYIKYIWYNFKYGYDNNPYEIEAYDRQDRPLNEAELKLWEESVNEHNKK